MRRETACQSSSGRGLTPGEESAGGSTPHAGSRSPLVPHLLSHHLPSGVVVQAMSSPEEEDGEPPTKRLRRGVEREQEQEEEEEDVQFEVQDLWKVKLFSGSCETCKATFTDPAYLLIHRPCYFGTPAFTADPAAAPDGRQYGCKFCVKRFPSLEQIRQHIRFHLEKRFYCKFCDYRGSSQYDVKYHSESVHSRQLPDYLRNKNKQKVYKSVGRGRRPTSFSSPSSTSARSPGLHNTSSSSRALVPAAGSSSSAAASLSLLLGERGSESESSEWGFSNMKLDDIHGLEDLYTVLPFSQVCSLSTK